MCLVVAHGGADPAVVTAHTGVDAGVSLHGTVITPGHHSLQLTITHQRTTRVSLQHRQTKTDMGLNVTISVISKNMVRSVVIGCTVTVTIGNSRSLVERSNPVSALGVARSVKNMY